MKSFDSPWVTDNIGQYGEGLEKLLALAHEKRYRAGQPVYIQGERSHTFYFLRRGRVKVSIFREDGSEKILAIQEDGTFFGESAALDDQPYFATAMALEASDIFLVDKDNLGVVMGADPDVGFMLLRALIRKMRLLALQVEDLSFLDAQKRVVHILLTLVHELGVEKEGALSIQKRITHDDLAHLTGLSRVTVTNILNYLEKLNIIKKRRCTLTILDRERLNGLLGNSLTNVKLGWVDIVKEFEKGGER